LHYNEIQEHRRKKALINYDRLQRLFGVGSYEQLRISHNGWVNEYMGDGKKERKEEWSGSLAVGNRPFVEKVKELVGYRAQKHLLLEH